MSRLGSWLKQRSETAVGMAGLFPAILRALNDSYPRSQARGNFGSQFKESPDSITGAVCFLLVLVLATIDCLSAPKINFTVFYLLIVAFASWNGSRKAGLFIVALSSIALFIHE